MLRLLVGDNIPDGHRGRPQLAPTNSKVCPPSGNVYFSWARLGTGNVYPNNKRIRRGELRSPVLQRPATPRDPDLWPPDLLLEIAVKLPLQSIVRDVLSELLQFPLVPNDPIMKAPLPHRSGYAQFLIGNGRRDRCFEPRHDRADAP